MPLVSGRGYWPLVIAVRAERMAWSRTVQRSDEREVRRAAERLRRFLAARPRRQKEIADAGLWAPGVGIWLDLVRVPPSGTWERRRADLFGLAQDWVWPGPGVGGGGARGDLGRR